MFLKSNSFFSILIFTSCSSDKKDGLEEEVKTIELTNIAWACDCANWATKYDLKKYSDNNGDTLADQCIFIEPASQELELPDTLGYSNDIIIFSGQFYNEKGFPKDYQSFENPDKARVFRYTKYEIVKSNYRENTSLLNEE